MTLRATSSAFPSSTRRRNKKPGAVTRPGFGITLSDIVLYLNCVSQSRATTAPTVAQRLIAQNELTAVLGAFASSLTLAISEVTARADIPFLTQAFADEITGRGLESVFQVTAKASVIGRAQVNYTLAIAEAAGSKIDKIAIMYEDTAYGVAQTRGLRRAAKDANIEVVMDEPYPLGIDDATPLINKLRASDAQAVFPLSYLNDSLFIIRTCGSSGTVTQKGICDPKAFPVICDQQRGKRSTPSPSRMRQQAN